MRQDFPANVRVLARCRSSRRREFTPFEPAAGAAGYLPYRGTCHAARAWPGASAPGSQGEPRPGGRGDAQRPRGSTSPCRPDRLLLASPDTAMGCPEKGDFLPYMRKFCLHARSNGVCKRDFRAVPQGKARRVRRGACPASRSAGTSAPQAGRRTRRAKLV